MTSYQATGWVESEPKRVPDYLPPSAYLTLPFEGSKTTGIRTLFDVSSIGSGSRYDNVICPLAELKDRLVNIDFSSPVIVVSVSSVAGTEITSPPTVGEKLDQIRDAFGLSMSALADILQSSRASVYNWFETDPRSAEILERIETLAEIARQWQYMSPYHYAPSKLMKQKLGGGPSMLERLARDVLDNDEIRNGMESLLALMKKQRERMDRAKDRSAKIPVDSESHKELLERLTGSVTADK